MKAEETWVQMSIFDFLSQDSWCGKMSKEPSQATTEKISDASLKKPQKLSKGMPLFLDLRTENGHIPDVSWEMGGQLLGDYMMHSFGEYPKEEKESRLSQILQGGALRKYYLSEKACQGILNRAERRGKELPKMLKDALIHQASLSKLGGDATQIAMEEKTKALNSSASDSDHVPCVYGIDRASFNQGINAKYQMQIDEEKTQTLVAKGPNAICARDSKGIGNQYVDEGKCVVEPYQNAVGSLCARDSKGTDSIVRRLTPMECERLQGFPDGWTDIGDWIDSKGKKHKGDSDSPRYKALGNSIALPFWQWMAERMVNILHTDGTEEPTMASLFDGIGGFPLVYSRVGCKPIWASEIEEFPIAVTKIRFPSN